MNYQNGENSNIGNTFHNQHSISETPQPKPKIIYSYESKRFKNTKIEALPRPGSNVSPNKQNTNLSPDYYNQYSETTEPYYDEPKSTPIQQYYQQPTQGYANEENIRNVNRGSTIAPNQYYEKSTTSETYRPKSSGLPESYKYPTDIPEYDGQSTGKYFDNPVNSEETVDPAIMPRQNYNTGKAEGTKFYEPNEKATDPYSENSKEILPQYNSDARSTNNYNDPSYKDTSNYGKTKSIYYQTSTVPDYNEDTKSNYDYPQDNQYKTNYYDGKHTDDKNKQSLSDQFYSQFKSNQDETPVRPKNYLRYEVKDDIIKKYYYANDANRFKAPENRPALSQSIRKSPNSMEEGDTYSPNGSPTAIGYESQSIPSSSEEAQDKFKTTEKYYYESQGRGLNIPSSSSSPFNDASPTPLNIPSTNLMKNDVLFNDYKEQQLKTYDKNLQIQQQKHLENENQIQKQVYENYKRQQRLSSTTPALPIEAVHLKMPVNVEITGYNPQ